MVDGLLEIGGDLTEDERGMIDSTLAANGRSYDEVLEEATGALAGLSACAGLVISPKTDPSRGILNSSRSRLAGRWSSS